MRLKLDENLPASLADALGELGHDVDTVAGAGLAGRPDEAVWSAALATQRALITQDLGLSVITRSRSCPHAGLVLVRLRSPSRAALVDRVRAAFGLPECHTWQGCIVVVTDRKVRVRRAPVSGEGG